jgi:hypothetical protein
MSLAQAQSAAGIIFDGRGDGAFYPTTLPPGYLHLFVDGDPVGCVGAEAGLSPQRQTVSTPEGVRLGDSTKKMLHTYGSRARYLPAPAFGITTRAGYVVPLTGGGSLVFGVDNTGTTITEISGTGLGANPGNCIG